MALTRGGIGLASDELVTQGLVERGRDGDRVVLDAPTQRDFWFGHGSVALYESLGFRPVAFDEAAVVTLAP